jgi:GrpB-like predicted nucleotidyltransferase (UPF0157 family)
VTDADPVIVVAYDPQWPQLFAELGSALRQALGDAALRIDHVGSTSVPGLDAKPVIDVQISVASFEPWEVFGAPLERLGFRWHADNPDRTKRYFREPSGTRRTHIHVRCAGSWSEQLTLLFRDYLRTHEPDARRYAACKYRLAEQYRDDREGYTTAKSPLIWEIVGQANRWSQEVGWEAGPSDA